MCPVAEIPFLFPLRSPRGLLDGRKTTSKPVSQELLHEIVRRTDGVSAAFIKELMRRATQFCVERDQKEQLAQSDADLALDEMLFRGGELNRKLLGASSQVEAEA